MLISTENTEDFWAKLLSLPSWERGLKQHVIYIACLLICVAPLVGAWIETTAWQDGVAGTLSLPSWERGLKLPQPVHSCEAK